MARHFTLAQASGLLREIEPELRAAARLRADLATVESQLGRFSRRIEMAGGTLVDPSEFLVLQGRRDALAGRLREVVEGIHAHGCQIKDLESGLVDFPTFYRGREVLLCWKAGEDGIRHWHGLEEGFRGRKPIDQDFLDHHTGDPVS